MWNIHFLHRKILRLLVKKLFSNIYLRDHNGVLKMTDFLGLKSNYLKNKSFLGCGTYSIESVVKFWRKKCLVQRKLRSHSGAPQNPPDLRDLAIIAPGRMKKVLKKHFFMLQLLNKSNKKRRSN